MWICSPLFIVLHFRNKSETIEETLDVTNEDLVLRRQEIINLNTKHNEEIEDLNNGLRYRQMNQSRVLDSLWTKVKINLK